MLSDKVVQIVTNNGVTLALTQSGSIYKLVNKYENDKEYITWVKLNSPCD